MDSTDRFLRWNPIPSDGVYHGPTHGRGTLATTPLILVCGGRDFDDPSKMYDVLDSQFDKGCILLQGDALGADRLALEWAQMNRVWYVGVPAAWEKNGKAAGLIRNNQMLDLAPIKVIAFPTKKSRGTWHTIKGAKARGIETVVID